jgi:hypothetical protein
MARGSTCLAFSKHSGKCHRFAGQMKAAIGPQMRLLSGMRYAYHDMHKGRYKQVPWIRYPAASDEWVEFFHGLVDRLAWTIRWPEMGCWRQLLRRN